jgi:xylulokinase
LLQGSAEEALPTALALEFDDLGIDALASGYLGATLFYIKENDPALFNRIAHVVLPTDFVRAKLLGACDYATDSTNACGAGIFNTRLNRWHEGVIRSLGLPLDILPTVHDTSEIAGLVPEAVARSLSLEPGTPVIYGGGDNQMSLLGNGLVSGESPVLINIGTGAQISKVTPTYCRVEGIDTRSYFNGYYVFAGSSLGGGRNYAQLKRELQRSGEPDLTYLEIDELAAQVAIGADGLQFHIRSRSKRHRQEGFTSNTDMRSIGQRARAVMEGVLMDLYMLCPPTDKSGLMIGSGNGLHGSRVWGQMAADFFACPIRVTNFENAVWGAALLAAVGVGLLPDLDEAVKSIKASREFEPNAANAAEYQQIKAERLECVYCEKLAIRPCIRCGRRFCEPTHIAYRDPDALLGFAPNTIKNATGYTCYKCWARFVQEFRVRIEAPDSV